MVPLTNSATLIASTPLQKLRQLAVPASVGPGSVRCYSSGEGYDNFRCSVSATCASGSLPRWSLHNVGRVVPVTPLGVVLR